MVPYILCNNCYLHLDILSQVYRNCYAVFANVVSNVDNFSREVALLVREQLYSCTQFSKADWCVNQNVGCSCMSYNFFFNRDVFLFLLCVLSNKKFLSLLLSCN